MICVHGLWHLGSVTAACLAEAGLETIGLADDQIDADMLSKGQPPLFEPGLADLVAKGLASGRLAFEADPAVVGNAALLWVTFDTPVDDGDKADASFVLDRVRALFPYLKDGAVVLLSSQLPVGSTATLERDFAVVAAGRQVFFAYSPENLRLGRAIEAFTKAERIVVGIRDVRARRVIEPVLEHFCPRILWMGVESAEMVKHALNTYLATCIVLANELATISEKVGADFADVEGALRLDPRVGENAYVRAGSAFGGGTLARDVLFLEGLAASRKVTTPLIGSIRDSNANHRDWVLQRLRERLGGLSGKRIGLLGLSYKAGTDAIRRSIAVELGRAIAGEGATVNAYDPKVHALPAEIAVSISVAAEPGEVFADADAVLVGTEWPEFRTLPWPSLVEGMTRRLVVDQNGYLLQLVAKLGSSVEYVALGRVL